MAAEKFDIKDLEKRMAELEQKNVGLENNLKTLEGKVSIILKNLNTEGSATTTAEVNPNSSTIKTENHEK